MGRLTQRYDTIETSAGFFSLLPSSKRTARTTAAATTTTTRYITDLLCCYRQFGTNSPNEEDEGPRNQMVKLDE